MNFVDVLLMNFAFDLVNFAFDLLDHENFLQLLKLTVYVPKLNEINIH